VVPFRCVYSDVAQRVFGSLLVITDRLIGPLGGDYAPCRPSWVRPRRGAAGLVGTRYSAWRLHRLNVGNNVAPRREPHVARVFDCDPGSWVDTHLIHAESRHRNGTRLHIVPGYRAYHGGRPGNGDVSRFVHSPGEISFVSRRGLHRRLWFVVTSVTTTVLTYSRAWP
jgi:hypothetical protein